MKPWAPWVPVGARVGAPCPRAELAITPIAVPLVGAAKISIAIGSAGVTVAGVGGVDSDALACFRVGFASISHRFRIGRPCFVRVGREGGGAVKQIQK